MNTARTLPKAPPPSPLEQAQAELSRTNLRLARVEQQLTAVIEMLLTQQRLHHGSQAAMRSWADKYSASIDKKA